VQSFQHFAFEDAQFFVHRSIMSDDKQKDKTDDVKLICNSKFRPREPFPESMLREAEQESAPAEVKMEQSHQVSQTTSPPPSASTESTSDS
jgi:hypothetical protein